MNDLELRNIARLIAGLKVIEPIKEPKETKPKLELVKPVKAK